MLANMIVEYEQVTHRLYSEFLPHARVSLKPPFFSNSSVCVQTLSCLAFAVTSSNHICISSSSCNFLPQLLGTALESLKLHLDLLYADAAHYRKTNELNFLSTPAKVCAFGHYSLLSREKYSYVEQRRVNFDCLNLFNHPLFPTALFTPFPPLVIVAGPTRGG